MRIALPFQRRSGSPVRRDDAGALADRYDAAARRWHAEISRLGYLDAYREMCSASFDRLAPTDPDAPVRVLDAGAGTGGFSLSFARAHGRLQDRSRRLELDLLDRSKPMLDIAERILAADGLAARSMVGGLGEHPIEPAAYDVVLCSHLVEHMSDPVAALAHLHRALRPGGVLLIVVSKPHWCTAVLRLVWRHRAFDDREVEGSLAQAGFGATRRHRFSAGPPSRTSMGYVAIRPADGEGA